MTGGAAVSRVTRMMVVWCPDWPVVAWGIPPDEPAAVFVANRVVASSAAARVEGVTLGQRRRDAQRRCPGLEVLERDIDREARLFEPVAAALEAITPSVEVSGPGLVGFPTRGPARFFGGESPLCDRVHEVVQPLLAHRGDARLGVADGVFAARLAARLPDAREGAVIVPVGASAAFLADLPITTLEQPELTDVFQRLGLDTLGLFAALSPADVVGRFGRDGQRAHRLARGEDEHPPDLRKPAADLAVTWEFEPPAERIDTCAFAAKALADELHAHLSAEGLACVRVAIEAETEAGESHTRLWRDEGALSAAALAERARWQLDGWLHGALGVQQRRRSRHGVGTSHTSGPSGDDDEHRPPSAGITRLTLIPDQVVPATGRQLGFWGGRAERADDVSRVVARLQSIMGPDAVSVPEWRGGRSPAEQIVLIPAAAVDLGDDRPATRASWVGEPWPGQLPKPSPTKVFEEPDPVEVVDRLGRPVMVNGRGEASGEPALVTIGRRRHAVEAWAGPWPMEDRWWDPANQRRRARFQVVLAEAGAHLLVVEHQQWWLEASYD
ncbi:MAG: DNA polymerase Y family protein [Acidimicrobiales bacterium]